MATKSYDCIVIGAGSGGLNIASFLNRVGLSVLLIERSEETVGGDCLNFGCVPSKALIHASREVAASARADAFGLRRNGEVDLSAVMAYVRARQDVIREHEHADYFRNKGIDVVIGTAAFADARHVRVGSEIYHGKRIVIATGSRPRELAVSGADSVPVYTNETIFSARELPQHLVVVGGGPIGFEIGQAFSRLGAQVTLVNRDDRWLAKEHRAVVAPLMERMEAEGVRFIPHAELTEVTTDAHAVITTADGTREEVPCSAVFVSIGRILNLEELDLDAAGIERDEQGKLILDPYLRTSNSRVFAVGDVVGQHQFTHAAEVHASLVLSNFFKPRPLWKKRRTDHMAWVTYTDPEIATFGRSESTLAREGVTYEVVEQPFSENDRSITDERTEGLVRIYVDRRGRILGGTMVGAGAGELVSELILAMTHSMTVADVFARVFPYPTAARINRLAAGAYLSKKLTPTVTRLMRALY